MENKGTKWGWIILWLIFVWPVGLYLLIKKLATDQSALMSGKTGKLSVVGWGLISFGVIGFFTEISDSPDSFGLILVLLFVLGGILLLTKVSKTKKTAVKYKKYIDLVVNQNIRSIDNIASILALSYDVVSNDLQDMINIGYLKDAYIHQNNREIILKQQETEIFNQGSYTEQTAPLAKSVRCPGCGANNVVTVGKISECEYCSTPINAQ